jgi:phosphate:Na+ symporter
VESAETTTAVLGIDGPALHGWQMDCIMDAMTVSVLTAIGGLGMFLLGMLVLTDGLKNLVGGRLQAFLARRTQSPASGAVAGAAMTAILQSSSATTVTAVGFVGAGMLTFNQALGIIFGANIGTTVTGWLVALVGFKLQLGVVLLPLLLAGVMLRLFSTGWLRHAGLALAGFALLFVGIDFLQQGMKALEGVVTPESLPADSFAGRIQLVLIGIGITLVTQSSSAGVATALAALGAGSISFTQAAAMVIGMDVGTTFTAAIASLGGNAGTRRTGFAHVIYNVLNGIMAFCLLYPLQWGVEAWEASGRVVDQQIGLVAFHTAFNVLGVLAAIGFTPLFARFITWLIPDSSPSLTAALDDRLLHDADAATYAAGASAASIALETLRLLDRVIAEAPGRRVAGGPPAVRDAAREARSYSDRITIEAHQPAAFARRRAILHILDHVFRTVHRCGQEERLELLRNDEELASHAGELRALIGELIAGPALATSRDKLDSFSQRMRELSHTMREDTIAMTSQRRMDSATALVRLDAIRWLHRVSYHVWRMAVHMPELTRQPAAPEPAQPPLQAG